MLLLENKTVIISGASSGIGRAAAHIFAREGARLVLVARTVDRLEECARAVRDLGGAAVTCPGDVTRPDTHQAAVDTALREFGGLHAAFNNAGAVGDVAPLADLGIDAWHDTLASNLTSAFLASRAQIPAMLQGGGGSLIFTSSFVGNSVGLPGMGAYAAAKAGLGGLVKSLAADYAHLGIRANALLPGGTDTAMAGSEANKAWVASLHPVGRIARPEEIANAALFLASDLSSFVIGSSLWADGGNAATKVRLAR
jgi:NAD(P)-dependent dehydrogenase (short-subunit alcohol dehydrogenase family)